MAFSFPPNFKECTGSFDLFVAVGPRYIIESRNQVETPIYVGLFATLHNIVNSLNLFVQVLCILQLLYKWEKNKGPFFIFILIFSITVSFRILYTTVVATIRAYNPSEVIPVMHLLLTDISLYVDYCSNLFSVTITFFLSLNRCLAFLAENWNSRMFEGFRVVRPILFSLFLSISGAVGVIITSDVVRYYYTSFGFLDIGTDIGFKVSINRFFNVFPIGSIACYGILYWFFHKESNELKHSSLFVKRGEQKVFYQLVVTSVLYIILNIMYELVIHFKNTTPTGIVWLKALLLANYVPEMSLSLLFILDTVNFRRIFKNLKLSTRREEPARITHASV